MKRTIAVLAVVALFIVATVAYAQYNGGRGRSGGSSRYNNSSFSSHSNASRTVFVVNPPVRQQVQEVFQIPQAPAVIQSAPTTTVIPGQTITTPPQTFTVPGQTFTTPSTTITTQSAAVFQAPAFQSEVIVEKRVKRVQIEREVALIAAPVLLVPRHPLLARIQLRRAARASSYYGGGW